MQSLVHVYEAESLATSSVPLEYQVPGTDIQIDHYDTFTIADARALKLQAAQRPIVGSMRVFVCVVRKMLPEAQNALLKLFEEPPETAQFFLVVRSVSELLPTLRSRVLVYSDTQQSVTCSPTGVEFLAASYSERLKKIETITKQKDTESIAALFTDLQTYIASIKTSDTKVVSAVITNSMWHSLSGASQKMLLEDVALRLPLA